METSSKYNKTDVNENSTDKHTPSDKGLKATVITSLLVTVLGGIAFILTHVILDNWDLTLRVTPATVGLSIICFAFLIFQVTFAILGVPVLQKSNLSRTARISITLITVLLILILDFMLLFGLLGYLLGAEDETGRTRQVENGEIIECASGFPDQFYFYYHAPNALVRSTKEELGSFTEQSLFADYEQPTVDTVEEDHNDSSLQNNSSAHGSSAETETPLSSDVPHEIEGPEGPPTGDIYYSVFLDEGLGFRMFSSASSSTLQRTTDAGTTWKTVDYPAVGDDEACRFIQSITQEESRLVAIVGYPSWIESSTTVTSYSYDEGLTWQTDSL